MTETCWPCATAFRRGAFQFAFDYQRADLEVTGEPIYPALAGRSDVIHRTFYTASGMAAISAILLALRTAIKRFDFIAPGGCYSETTELIEKFGAPARIICDGFTATSGSNILLLDSSVTENAEWYVESARQRKISAVLFDTTCLWSGSGRIRRVLTQAFCAGLPVLLVRSHTKLDSLGVEYGRLGSIVTTASPRTSSRHGLQQLKKLMDTTADAVRLTGGAAIPAHFPPYAGRESYQKLGAARVAATQANSRCLVRVLRKNLPSTNRLSSYSHGLFITFAPIDWLTLESAREAAERLCRELAHAGVPARHAGSFGFDFVTAEWASNSTRSIYVVRMSVPDLPWCILQKGVAAIRRWWLDQQGAHAVSTQMGVPLVATVGDGP